MRIIRRIRSWLKLKKRVKDDSPTSSKSSSPRRKRSRSLTDSAIPSYATRHAQFFTTGSNAQFDLAFNPAPTRNDDTASDITPRDAGATLGRRDLGMLRQKHSAQSIRIVPPSPRRPLAVDDHESSLLFAEQVPSATTAMSPPLVPFSVHVHPKSTSPLTAPHSSLQQLPPDNRALSDSQLLTSPGSNQGDPCPDISPDRLAGLRRASGVNSVLTIYDNAGAIGSKEFDNGTAAPSDHDSPRPSSVARVDEESRRPSSPNRRRYANTGRSDSSSPAPLPFASHTGTPRAQLGIPSPPGLSAGDATFGSTDTSFLSSTTASILHSSSERELATSEISTAAHVNLARVQQAKTMGKDATILPAQPHDAANVRPPALKLNALKKIMSINALDNELENQERNRMGGSLPSSPTWGPEHQSFPRLSTPTNPQVFLPSPASAQGDLTRSVTPLSASHSSSGLSSSHPALTPPPKHRKAPPSRLRRPKTADDATALSPPPWRSISSSSGKDDVMNVKDMGGGVSVVRIPAAQRTRRPATATGVVSPTAGKESSFSRSIRGGETIQETPSHLVASPSFPESEASFRTYLTTPRNGQESAFASATSLVPSARGMNSKNSTQVLSKRRSVRSKLTVPGEDENTPLRRKHSYGRSPVIRKSISEGALETPEKDAAGSERKVKRFGSLRKIGTIPLKKGVEDQTAGDSQRRHRRKKRTHNRPRLSFVLATDVDLGSSTRQSYLGIRRVSSVSSLGSAFSDDDNEAGKEGNDFTDSRSTFGKYNSDDGAGSDEEPTTESWATSTVEEVVEAYASTPSRSDIDLSAELSEETKQMMTSIRERKGKKSASSGLRTALARRSNAFLA